MDGLVTGHVIAIAFWAGLVAVEVLFEAAGVSGKIDVRSAALLHRWTDRYLELPVLAAVAGTGVALWARMGWDAGVAWKVGAGLGAIMFNLVCYVLVARGVNLAGDEQADRRAHGGPDKAVYAYAIEDTRWWERNIGRALGYGEFGENLTTEGIEVNDALVGERWQVGTAILEVSEPRVPCWRLGVRM